MASVSGTIHLEGESDYSGVLVNVLGSGCLGSTGEQGAFYIKNVPEGTRMVLITKDGWQNQTHTVNIQAGQNTSLGTITLNLKKASLEGMAQKMGQSNHQGILVQLQDTSFTTVTTPNGGYEFNNVPEGQYTVKATHPNYSTATVGDQTVKEGETTLVPILQLQPDYGIITGKVKLEGAIDHTGIIVGVGGTGCLGVSGPDGTFIVKEVPIGEWVFVASKTGWENHTSSITIQPDQTLNVGTIQLPLKRASLEGMVELSGQTDHQGVLVQLQGTTYAVLTVPSGAYQFNNVPEGQYTVIASRPNYFEASVGDQTVKHGHTTQVPRLELQAAYGTVQGTLKLEGEKNAMGVIVSVVGTGCLDVSDPNGAFIIKEVPVGTRTLITIKPGWASKTASFSVQPGQTTNVRAIVMEALGSQTVARR